MSMCRLPGCRYRADSEERRRPRQRFVDRVLATVPVLPFDLAVARVAERVGAQFTVKSTVRQ